MDENPKLNIWRRDLLESRIFSFVFLWFVLVPSLLVLLFCGAILFGVALTVICFVCIFTVPRLYDLWREQNRVLSAEERMAEEWRMRSALDDYWYLRDMFIRLMLDIQEPIEGPWYDRNSVRWFISLWEHDWPVDSIQWRLHRAGRKAKADRERMVHLHAIAKRVGQTFDRGCYFDSRAYSARDVEILRSFFEEVTVALLAIDRWFAQEEWPPDFQPRDEWSEFKEISLTTVVKGAPFRQ